MTDTTSRSRTWLRGAYPAAQVSLDPVHDEIWRRLGLDPQDADSTEPDEDEDEDEDSGYDRDALFEQLMGRVPAGHRLLDTVNFHIDHSPGLSWEIDMTWILAPAENPTMDWMLYCLDWDDNWGRYAFKFLAECKGFPSAELSAAAMLETVFESWNLHDDPDYPGWKLVDDLKSAGGFVLLQAR